MTAANCKRIEDLKRFYDHLGRVETRAGGKRNLASCTGKSGWPERGVYFFFEDGESRSNSGQGPRVVRVGTHAITTGSKTKLWDRLLQHRGSTNLGGNNRGSVFRLLVGGALSEKDPTVSVTTWGNKRSYS